MTPPRSALSRRAFAAALLAPACPGLAAATARIEPAQAVEGVRLPPELIDEATLFPAAITRGGAAADVTIIVFTDANCPWCRRSYPDLQTLAATDRRLRLVLIDWPVLGVASIQAAKVGYGVLAAAGPAAYARYIGKTMAAKGVVDGPRALALVAELGLDRAAVERRADEPRSGALARQAVEVGSNLGFFATPAYVVHDHGFSGALPIERLRAMAAAVRRCERVDC